MPTSMARPAVTAIVIDQLDAVKRAHWVAGFGKTLVHVSFATRPDVPGPTLALVAIDTIEASPTMMTCTFKALVDIDFAQGSHSSMAARACKLVDQVVTGASISTGVRVAVVDIVFAVESLKSFWAVTGVLAN